MSEKRNTAVEAVSSLLSSIGEDTSREGLLNTPHRYVKFLNEFMSPPEFNMTCFDSEGFDEMIVMTDIPFYSLCEHHMAPFFGVGHIAYVPNGKIVGLSKLARVLDHFSRRLQNQERVTMQVATFLEEHLQPKGVAVVLKAEHLCMAMRGVNKPGAKTTTSRMVGIFKDDHKARHEFLELIP
jgi:GTP cyclohydrolase IA